MGSFGASVGRVSQSAGGGVVGEAGQGMDASTR